MKLSRIWALPLVCVCLLASSSAFGATFNFTGALTQDDQRFEAVFVVGAPSLVSIQTWSYAGGVDPLGAVVSPGGFAAVLSIFDSIGNIIGSYDAGGVAPGACAPRNIDGVSGFCLDAYLFNVLIPDSYTVVLTQLDNTPSGSLYSDGFSRDGQGNFTGPANLGVPGSFIAPFGFPRTGDFHLSIDGVDSAAVVPEPSTGLLVVAVLAAGVVVRRRKRKI